MGIAIIGIEKSERGKGTRARVISKDWKTKSDAEAFVRSRAWRGRTSPEIVEYKDDADLQSQVQARTSIPQQETAEQRKAKHERQKAQASQDRIMEGVKAEDPTSIRLAISKYGMKPTQEQLEILERDRQERLAEQEQQGQPETKPEETPTEKTEEQEKRSVTGKPTSPQDVQESLLQRQGYQVTRDEKEIRAVGKDKEIVIKGDESLEAEGRVTGVQFDPSFKQKLSPDKKDFVPKDDLTIRERASERLFEKLGYKVETTDKEVKATKEGEQVIVTPSGDLIARGRVTDDLKFQPKFKEKLGTGEMKTGFDKLLFSYGKFEEGVARATTQRILPDSKTTERMLKSRFDIAGESLSKLRPPQGLRDFSDRLKDFGKDLPADRGQYREGSRIKTQADIKFYSGIVSGIIDSEKTIVGSAKLSSDLAVGFGSGVVAEVRDRPVTTAVTAVAGAGVGAVAGRMVFASKAARFAFKGITGTAGAVYVGTKGVQVATAETDIERGRILGGATVEVAAFGGGAKLGTKIPLGGAASAINKLKIPPDIKGTQYFGEITQIGGVKTTKIAKTSGGQVEVASNLKTTQHKIVTKKPVIAVIEGTKGKVQLKAAVLADGTQIGTYRIKRLGKDLFVRTTTQPSGKATTKVFSGDKLIRTFKTDTKPDVAFTEPTTQLARTEKVSSPNVAREVTKSLKTSDLVTVRESPYYKATGKMLLDETSFIQATPTTPKVETTFTREADLIAGTNKLKVKKIAVTPEQQYEFVDYLPKQKPLVYAETPEGVIRTKPTTTQVTQANLISQDFTIRFEKKPKTTKLKEPKITEEQKQINKENKKAIQDYMKQARLEDAVSRKVTQLKDAEGKLRSEISKAETPKTKTKQAKKVETVQVERPAKIVTEQAPVEISVSEYSTLSKLRPSSKGIVDVKPLSKTRVESELIKAEKGKTISDVQSIPKSIVDVKSRVKSRVEPVSKIAQRIESQSKLREKTIQTQKQTQAQRLGYFPESTTRGRIGRTPPIPAPRIPPPALPKLRFPERVFGKKKDDPFKVKQPKSYTPTAFAAAFEIVGKATKAGIKTGLGVRPIKAKRKKLKVIL